MSTGVSACSLPLRLLNLPISTSRYNGRIGRNSTCLIDFPSFFSKKSHIAQFLESYESFIFSNIQAVGEDTDSPKVVIVGSWDS